MAKSPAFLGTYNAVVPSLSNGEYSGVQFDNEGNLLVNVVVGGGGGGGTGTQTVVVLGTSTVAVAGTSTVEVAGIVGTSTVTVAGGVAASITGTATVTVVGTTTAAIVGTSTVEVAGIVGTSTVTVAGGVAASITGTATVTVVGTSTVQVAGIVGTSTVTVSGTVTAACTGTQTVTVVGTSTVAVAGTSTVQVAGIVGTSTVTVAGGIAASITGTATVTVAGTVTAACSGTQTTTIAGNVTVVGAAATGAGVSGNPVLVAGKDSSNNVEPFSMDTSGHLIPAIVNAGAADASNNTGNFIAGNAAVAVNYLSWPFVFNGTTWDRSRSGSVLGSNMVQVTSTPTVNIAGLFTAQTNTTTITASSTLAVAAATRWEVKAIVFKAICSNTVTKQVAVWITDASGNVIWETQGPVVTPTNTLCLEHTIYPAVTSQTAYTPLVRGTSTSVIILSMPDLVLGASFTINATMVGAAATQTYTLVVNAIIE